jgi:hypothetical protein
MTKLILMFFSLLKNPKLGPPIIFAMLLCAWPGLASAQMFSIDNNSTPNGSIPGVAVYVGIEPTNFEYQGSGAEETERGLYGFNGPIARFSIEGRGINAYLGTGGSITGLDDISYFDAGVKIGYGLSVYRAEDISVHIPFQLHSAYTRSSNNDVAIPGVPEFQQGTFEIAGGAELNARLAPQFRIGANILPSYGFSFSTRERDAGGRIFGVEGEARLYFDRLFGSAGLSVGYNYNLRDYDIEGELLDYKATGHSFLVGITF